jgi:hypothetical protein
MTFRSQYLNPLVDVLQEALRAVDDRQLPLSLVREGPNGEFTLRLGDAALPGWLPDPKKPGEATALQAVYARARRNGLCP